MLFHTLSTKEAEKMIKKEIYFSDVPIEALHPFGLTPEERSFVAERGIRTIQDFVNETGYMGKESDLYSDVPQVFRERVGETIAKITDSNKKGREPDVYLTPEYEDNSLKLTDTLNSGNVLLLDNPTTENPAKYSYLKGMPVSTIKEYLRFVKPDGSNYLISKVPKVGVEAAPRILTALDMYSEQVARQAKLTDLRDINLFTYQQKEKEEIVKKLYDNMMEYLLGTVSEFVWGELSDMQKQLYLLSIENRKKIGKIIRYRMISIISNYTTLPELEGAVHDDFKVLKRFIKR